MLAIKQTSDEARYSIHKFEWYMSWTGVKSTGASLRKLLNRCKKYRDMQACTTNDNKYLIIATPSMHHYNSVLLLHKIDSYNHNQYQCKY